MASTKSWLTPEATDKNKNINPLFKSPLEQIIEGSAQQQKIAYGKSQYNQAINDAIAAIDKLCESTGDFASFLHIKIENELDKLKKI